ncbi:hypothetical protein V6Z11_A07G218500 [Gossypium hirsutum]
MENGLLDRVEGNADVHRCITIGYVSELSDYTRISVTQNNLQELKEIWDHWGNETKQLFYDNYGDLPYLLDIQFWNPAYSCFTFGEVDLVPTVEEYTALLRCPRFQSDKIYSRAACVPTFWKKLIAITGMSEQWITARIKEKGECKCISWDDLKDLILTHPDKTKKVDIFALSLYGQMVFPRALGYVDEATTNLFHRLSKRVTFVPAILAETFRSLGACKRAGAGRFIGCAQLLLAWFYSHFRLIDRIVCRVFFENYSPVKDIVASSRKVDVPEENWIALLWNLQSEDIEWRAPWMVPGEILYRCGSFNWVPLLGIWGAIGYAPLLVLRQHGLRQFVPVTHGLAQSEFVYRGVDYKKKWLKGVANNPATTPKYVEWRSRRINNNIPMTKMEKVQPMEEYLQVIPSELDIMKQEFKRKNLELEKKIEKLEEEKMYLSLDVDLQKKEVEKFRKEKRKWQKEVQEEKARAEYWEKKFQEMRSQNLALEKENKGLKTKVTDLGRSLHWHRNHDPTVELREPKK